MRQNVGSNSKSAILYEKRLNELSPKHLQNHNLNQVHNSDFHSRMGINSYPRNWRIEDPIHPVDIQQNYYEKSNSHEYQKRSYKSRQLVRDQQWQKQRSKIAKLNQKLEQESSMRLYNHNRNINDPFMKRSRESDRIRKHRIFQRNIQNKSCKLKSSDMMRKSGSHESRYSYRNCLQNDKNYLNPAHQKIASVKMNKSKTKKINQMPPPITRVIYTPQRYPVNYQNPHSIRMQSQNFRPDAPVIISYSSPLKTPLNFPPAHYSQYPIINYLPPPNAHILRGNPQLPSEQPPQKPFLHQQIITSSNITAQPQNTRKSNINSVSSSNNWNSTAQSRLSDLARKPIIYRSIELKDQNPNYFQYDKIKSTERKQHIPLSNVNRQVGNEMRNGKIMEQNNLQEYNDNVYEKKNQTVGKKSSSQFQSSETHNDFYDFSPSNLCNKKSTALQTPQKEKNEKFINYLISPNTRKDGETDYECDRFFDMDFNEGSKKFNSTQQQAQWLNIKSTKKQLLSPLQHKYNILNNSKYEELNPPEQQQPKTQQKQSNLGRKLANIFNNADTQGKIITLILVGVGLILVLLQACK